MQSAPIYVSFRLVGHGGNPIPSPTRFALRQSEPTAVLNDF
jgi:hypothetical protein